VTYTTQKPCSSGAAGTAKALAAGQCPDPTLGRFISADTIVPGAASGAGGGVTTLGYDRNTRLTPLTVNLGEFAEQIGAENREVLQFGAFFQWDGETRQEHNVPMGPANPQALNRYAYCLGNPLRYVDPTGHESEPEWLWIFETDPENMQEYINILESRSLVAYSIAEMFSVLAIPASALAVGTGGAIIPLDVFALTAGAVAGGAAIVGLELEHAVNYLQSAVDSADGDIRVGVYKQGGTINIHVNGASVDIGLLPCAATEFYNVFNDPEAFALVEAPEDVRWIRDENWGWLYPP
jgi:hypothetical protein